MTVASGATTFEKVQEEISIHQALGFVLDNAKLALSGFALGLIGAVLYLSLVDPVYNVQSTIQVKPEKPSEASFIVSDHTSAGNPSMANVEIQIIRSLSLVQEAVNQVNADVTISPKRIPVLGDLVAAISGDSAQGHVNKSFMGSSSFGWGRERLKVETFEIPKVLSADIITLVAGEGGAYTVLNADGQKIDDGKVGRLLDSKGYKLLVTELVANPEMQFSIAKENAATTALRYQRELLFEEAGVDSGIVSISIRSDKPNEAAIFIDKLIGLYVEKNAERAGREATIYLEFIKSQLPEIENKVNAAELLLNNYRQVIKSVDISLEVPAILNRLVELDSQISKLKLKQAELATRFTSEHPAYQMVKGQVEAVEAERSKTAEKLSKLPDNQQELVRLTRDVKVNNELYVTMLNRVQELEVSHKSAIGNIAILDQAYYDVERPVSPNKTLIIAVSTLLGVFLAFVYALVKKLFNPGVSRFEEFEQLGLEVYAAVPFTEKLNFKSGKKVNTAAGKTLAALQPANPAMEAIRTLRAGLHFALDDPKVKVIMVTGPTMDVGKSFVSSNLATVFAQAGKRVLLIDADMRKGMLHQQFGVEAGPGLADTLDNKVDAETILKTSSAGVYLLTRGALPSLPSELLMNGSFERLINLIKSRFDLIIIDTPPVLPVADAAIIGRYADINILVTRFETTSIAEIKECQSRFRHSGLRFDGAVINAVEKRHVAGYGKAYQAYSYGVC